MYPYKNENKFVLKQIHREVKKVETGIMATNQGPPPESRRGTWNRFSQSPWRKYGLAISLILDSWPLSCEWRKSWFVVICHDSHKKQIHTSSKCSTSEILSNNNAYAFQGLLLPQPITSMESLLLCVLWVISHQNAILRIRFLRPLWHELSHMNCLPKFQNRVYNQG